MNRLHVIMIYFQLKLLLPWCDIPWRNIMQVCPWGGNCHNIWPGLWTFAQLKLSNSLWMSPILFRIQSSNWLTNKKTKFSIWRSYRIFRTLNTSKIQELITHVVERQAKRPYDMILYGMPSWLSILIFWNNQQIYLIRHGYIEHFKKFNWEWLENKTQIS